ncbi:MAG: MarR family winged helix-turn-helix transcriptional regulator [Bacteroidales bacterium]
MEQIEQPIGRILSMLGKGYLHLLRTKLQHLDIDRNYYALVIIAGDDGEITQQELALLLGQDKVSIVRVVDYLSEKGYIKRIKKPDDLRKHRIMLTEKAKLAIPEILESFKTINKLVLNGLSEMQVSEFAGTISKIKNTVTENIKSI